MRTSGLGRPPLHSKRELLNHDLPPWRTVYKQFEAWRKDGTWDRLLTGLRQQVRYLGFSLQREAVGQMKTNIL